MDQKKTSGKNLNKQKKCGYIFRPWITRNGIRYYAKDYGYKAWRIPINVDK